MANVIDTTSQYWRGTVTWRRRPAHLRGEPRADLRVGYFMNQFPNLTETLLKRGHSESVVRKILGENWVRVLGDVWGE